MKITLAQLRVQLALLIVCMSGLPGSVHAVSLYDESTYRSMSSDNKAARPGDVLTVQVFETSSAQASADTDTRRKNSVAANVAKPGGATVAVGLGVQSDFDGGGRTQRTSRLLATLTVTVKEVLPNGDLRVAGEQLLTVNNEQQKVNLEGRVRPQDISDANVVLSTRVAEAKITYVGDGDVSDRQQRGWWRKLLDAFGL